MVMMPYYYDVEIKTDNEYNNRGYHEIELENSGKHNVYARNTHGFNQTPPTKTL
jgi:hypothetical protein